MSPFCIHLRGDNVAPTGHTIWPVKVTWPNGEFFSNAHSVAHALEQIAAHDRAVARRTA